MNLLIVAATKLEIKPFLKKINYHNIEEFCVNSLTSNSITFDVLISGVGLVSTTYHLLKALKEKTYDLVLNVGIAGSFNRSIAIGDVVNVVVDEFADLGIEMPDNFQTLFDSGFVKKDAFPFKEGKLFAQNVNNELINSLRRVVAISSNTAHGNENTIQFLEKKFNAEIETMEGAAFFYVCLMEKVNFVALRSISNYVEARNPENWDIPLAVNNLSDKLFQIIFDTLFKNYET